MHRTSFAVLLAAAISACGGSDPISECRKVSDAVCNRLFECEPAGAQQLFGSVANCTTISNDRACTPEGTACPTGYSSNTSNWERCIEDYRHASCGDIANGIPPASCGTVCTR